MSSFEYTSISHAEMRAQQLLPLRRYIQLRKTEDGFVKMVCIETNGAADDDAGGNQVDTSFVANILNDTNDIVKLIAARMTTARQVVRFAMTSKNISDTKLHAHTMGRNDLRELVCVPNGLQDFMMIREKAEQAYGKQRSQETRCMLRISVRLRLQIHMKQFGIPTVVRLRYVERTILITPTIH